MKKKINLLIPLLFLSVFILCACGDNDNNSEGNSKDTEREFLTYEEGNILSFEKVSPDNNNDTFLKITNDGNTTVYNVNISYNILNNEGELISPIDYSSHISYQIEPGKFAYIDITYSRTNSNDELANTVIDSVKVLNYQYTSGDYEYTVNPQTTIVEKTEISKSEVDFYEMNILSFELESNGINSKELGDHISYESKFSIKNNGDFPVSNIIYYFAYLDDSGNVISEGKYLYSTLEDLVNDTFTFIQPGENCSDLSISFIKPSLDNLIRINNCVVYEYSYEVNNTGEDEISGYTVNLLSNTATSNNPTE